MLRHWVSDCPQLDTREETSSSYPLHSPEQGPWNLLLGWVPDLASHTASPRFLLNEACVGLLIRGNSRGGSMGVAREPGTIKLRDAGQNLSF